MISVSDLNGSRREVGREPLDGLLTVLRTAPAPLFEFGDVPFDQPAAYSDDADHQFRQADHRFRSMPITLEERRSIAALGGRVFGVEV